MKPTKFLKWYLVFSQIISIGFCIFAICFSNKMIEEHKKMTSDMADSIEKFRNVYVIADSDRKTLLVNKTAAFVVSENNSITNSNTYAFLEIQDIIQGIIVLNVFGIVCAFYMEIKKRGQMTSPS